MTFKPEQKPDTEDRLLALLALNSQELPDDAESSTFNAAELRDAPLSPERAAALHQYLDANPQAFEAFLQRHRASAATPEPESRQPRSWRERFAAPPRFALAAGVAALCAGLIFSIMFLDGQPNVTALDEAYQELMAHVDGQSFDPTTDEQLRSEPQLAFSARPKSATPAARSFGAGVIEGEARLRDSNRSPSLAYTDDAFFSLGEWNVLLTASCAMKTLPPSGFWAAQRKRFDALADGLYAERQVDPLVTVHLRRVEALLAELARGGRTARTAHELRQELRLFRGQFARYDAPR